jgi:hypothetical protein
MRLFRSEEDVAAWQEASGEHGETVPAAQLHRLAGAWYGDRLDPGWRPRTTAQSQAVLEEAGLTGPFWQLDAGPEA